MLRIAHISDLHFVDSSVDEDAISQINIFSRLAYTVGNVIGPDVVADRHSEDKWEALKNIFRSIRPDVIVVTGDITNYGDVKSFELARKRLDELKAIAEAKHLFCIPGNHDCLAERVEALSKKGMFTKGIIRTLAIFNSTASNIRRLSLDPKLKDLLKEGSGLPLLKTYQRYCTGDFGEIDPGSPIFVDAGWGEVAFFLFNSTNDPEFMANEGSIGAFQYNALNRYLDNPVNLDKITSSIRIALLHHHPLNNPDEASSGIDRFYDQMTDGTQFLEYLGKRKFHFIFHGHQHRKYFWQFLPGLRPHISAAGSALAGDRPDGSFNVIDLLTPFEAVYQRYDYTTTGFERVDHAQKTVGVHSLDDIRVSKLGEPKTGLDVAIQNLFAGRKDAFDRMHQYELLDFDITISPSQLYRAKYRRKGRVTGSTISHGITYVVTGNPPMSFEDMQVSAKDAEGNSLFVDCPYNSGTQKVIRVLHTRPISPGTEFDITLEFGWQASEQEPHHNDAVNLMYFLREVGCFSYSVNLPWKVAQFEVTAYALRKSYPELTDFRYRQNDNGTHDYSFKIHSPEPLIYLISMGPTPPD